MNRFFAFVQENQLRADNPARSLTGVLLEESFTDEAFPPNGWSTAFLEGTENAFQWTRNTLQSNTPPASAHRRYSAAGSGFQDDWLVTPAISLPAGENATISYFDRAQFMSFYDYTGLWVSTGSCDPADGEFVEIAETNDMINLSWRQVDFELTEYAGQTICLAFRYSGQDAHSVWIDDVVVAFGDPALPPVAVVNPASFDVESTVGDTESRMFTISNEGEEDLEFLLGVTYFDAASRRDITPVEFTYESRGEVIRSSTAAIENPFASVMAFGDNDMISFEESEGFVPGFINEQNGWTTFSSNLTQPAISPARATDGVWSLELAKEPDVTGSIGAFSPLFSLETGIALIEQDIFIEALGGSDYDVILQAPSQALLAARVKFFWQGGIRVLDNPAGSTVFVQTGVPFPVDEWFTLGIKLNSFDESVEYYLNGELFYTGNMFGASTIEQIIYLHDNFNEGEAGYVDNVRLTEFEGPIQWLSADITSGTITGGSSETIMLSFDTSIDVGSYAADLIVLSNDPENSAINVPILYTLSDAPVDPIEGEIVINGTFDNGLNSWTPYVADFAGVNADFSVVDGEAAITNMTGPTNEVWFVQLNQVFTQEQIAELEVGETYIASFDARSSVDGRQLRFYFGEDGGGFVPVNITDFNLTTSMETYQVIFEVTNTFGAMKLGFEMGLSNADVFLDNVSLMLAPESETDPIAGVSPDSIEFDLGIGESATSVLEVLNLAGMGADDLEFSIAVENAAARNYSSGVRTQFATVQGADRASGAVTPAGTIDAVVAHNAALMAIDEFSEGFADIETLPADGWSLQNLSTPVGTTTWFQGNPAVFPAFSGEETHYIGANFNSTTGSNTINTWLLTPEVTLQNGTELRFYTRSTGGNFPDRLEVRLSTAGGSTNAGTDPASTGDFTTLMLTVNPDLVTGPNGYPDEWTEFVATVEGLDAATTGRFGLRYFVTSGGPAGDNSDYIGIDEVRVVQPENGETPEPLVVDPTSGSVSAGGSAMVNVTANTQGLMVGSYGYNLLITSNDPANGLITVPVTVDVNDDSFAQVQVIHNAADPALAEVDVYVNGGLFATNFPFRGATEYLTVPANVELTLEIMAPGGSEALLSLSVVPEADESYAVIAQGVADPDGFAPNPDGLEIGAELVVLTDRQATGGGDTFDLYVFHGATDAPAVDVFVRELGTNILTGVPYGTGSGYFSVDPGVYVIEIRPAGSTTPVAAFIADVTGFGGLSAGILASGFLNPDQGEAFGLLVALETGDTAFIPGTTGPSLLITPSAFAFGEVAEGFFAEQMVTFTNAGTSNLIIFDATTDNDAFSIDFGDVEIVSPGGTRTFTVTFSPDVAGEYSGDLLVETNDPAGVKTAALTGTGVFGASVVFDPSEIVAELAANTSDTFELTITNEGNGALEFAFPDYIMERILDGTDTRFDAVRQRMMVQVRSAFENTEEQMNANLQRFMMHEAGIETAAPQRSAVQQSGMASGLNSGGFLIEFDQLSLPGGNFITVAEGLNGELTSVVPDFVINSAQGATWASDFALLFTTVALAPGVTVDPATVALQVGGFNNYGASPRIDWTGGTSGAPGTPVNVPVAIPTPLDVSGLFVSIGNGWTISAGGVWSGTIELVGVSAGADFITEVVPAFGVVAPGDSETITLTLDAAGLIGGVYTGVLGVLTNDPANPEVAIPATLTVFGEPIADVDPAELDFGSVFVGNSVTDGVLLTNTGSDVLLVSGFSTDSEEFVVSSQELELEAGESVVINISFAPESDGNKSAMLTIESNASNGDVTVALSGVGSNAGILSFDPSSFSVTVEQGATSTATLLLTNEGESDLEFNIGTSNTVAPTSGRSVLVRNERSAQAIDQVSSLSNSMRISGSNATLQSAAPGWHAVRQTMPSVLNSETEIIWNQQNNGTGGGVSDFFQPLGSGAYSADDFLLEEGANLQVITAYGFVGPADGVPITTGANGVGIFIYPDNNGLPAGHPQDGQNSHVFSFTGGFNSAGLTIIEEAAGAIFTDIVLDIEAATGSALNLPAGTYWIMVFVDTNGQLGGPARWNWSQGEPNLNSGQLIDPGGLFGANTNWQSWAGITNGDWSDLAFMIEGNFGSFVDTDPAQGVIAPGGSVEVVVTFDATDLEPGDYFANINITTNSPITPSATIPVAMTVEEGAGQPSELVTFQVDMSVQSSLGNFNPGVGDEVFVLGSFNDWSVVSGNDMEDSGEMVYTYTVELFGEAGTLYEYKYFILAGDGRELPNGGWEFDSVGEGGSTNRQVFLTGDDQTLPVVFFNNQDAVNVEPEFDMPTEFALNQNYPNPFNPTTNIVYALPEASEVTLEVFNLQGQRVAVLVRGQQTAGFHTVNFDASRLASGMYLYRLQAGNFVQTQKMMLVK
ncbi:MAG: choice-of-anchor J domain-containing protein [Candidatus Cyclonatronum sp.]|uniref:T9SS-dependent choice-of-anchor J family protein n=1 Tax=Cyclonatronum sp. TaxID=3024185 RepID=UPI0025B9E083|nr:choice-of-anchor J domain-containing protein [Cyclonatronum sp.]MCH8487223.1 choice-of-anchor J domain-containing protein [Cyclonatronum sp.]